MRILITGSLGQLGSELRQIITNRTSELGVLPAIYHDAELLMVDVDELDITDKESVDAYFVEHKPSLVFNCAAYTNVDGCESDEETAYCVNALGAKHLAQVCAGHRARLIHLSTDYVFSGEGTVPYTESDKPDPRTAYGRTKRAGEEFVLGYCPDSIVCRTAWLYGHEGGNFVKTMLRLAREKGELTVVSDQVGNPTCAVDLAWQLVLLAASSERGIFHATGNGEPVSWHTFAKRIVSQADLDVSVHPCTTDEFPRPARRPAFSALDNKRLRDTIGDSMREWTVALDSFLEEYLKKEGIR
jgi:dTDP-4-dehydrorhamnose reductase